MAALPHRFSNCTSYPSLLLSRAARRVGLSAPLTFLIVLLAAPPEAAGWAAPRFERGQEIPFVGEIVDQSDRVAQKFRNVYELNVRLLVLESSERFTDFAVLTAITPTADQGIANAAKTVSGEVIVTAKTSARVEFIRVDSSGNAKKLKLPKAQPPFTFTAEHPTETLQSTPIAGVSYSEFGFFPPRKVGIDHFERNWQREEDTLWNGSRVIDLVSIMASKDYENPSATVTGWRRSDRLYISPMDGLPRAYARRIEQREGKNVIANVEMRLEMKSVIPPGDAASMRHLRREAEFAAWFASEADRLRINGRKTDPKESAILQSRIKRFLEESQPAGSFRPAVDATARLVIEMK